jgi:hypothetical protein
VIGHGSRLIVLVAVAIAMLTLTAVAQERAAARQISGRVVFEGGEPAGTVNLGIGAEGRNDYREIPIEANGTFASGPLEPGVYRLSVTAAGYVVDAAAARARYRPGDTAVITLRKGGVITASTFGRGDAGDMQITTGRLILRGSTQHEFTGLFARTVFPATSGQGGKGGDIRINARSIEITNRATISAQSVQSLGDAGGISINITGPASLTHGGQISVSSELVNGGDIVLSSADAISLANQARIAASANQTGGNVRINAKQLSLSNSIITGQAGLNGASITINADAVSLGSNSTINGLAGGNDVIVDINGALLQAVDSAILSDNATFIVDTDLASSLVPFNVDVAGASARLQDFCGIRAARISSFTVTGRGGLSLDPARVAPAK